MTAGAIPVLKTSPKIWGVLGGALYRARSLLPVTLREIFQNSRDACRGLERQPKIALTLETDDWQSGRLTCQDNGCGMSEETLLNKFLVLGESEKAEGSAGGWGIAKAIVVGGACRWELRTNGLRLTSGHLENGCPIDHVAPIAGTQVVLEYEPIPAGDPRRGLIGLTLASFARGLSWLAHNDTPSVISLIYQGKETVWRFSGLAATEACRLCGERSDKTAWTLRQLPAVEIEPAQCDGWGRCSIASSGQAFYRLNGLAQFSAPVSDSHQDVFLVDVETSARAGESDYPFTPNRESVTGDWPAKIEAALKPHQLNPLTSMTRQRDRTKPVDVLYYDGQALGHRGRPRPTDPVQSQRLASAQLLVAPGAALSHASIAQPVNVIQGRFISPVGVKLLFKGLSRTRRGLLSQVNRRFLLAWGKVIDLIMEANGIWEEFGLGFLFHPSEAAERHVDANGTCYYLINPGLVSLRAGRPAETLLRMFMVAAHEIAHRNHSDHDESFTSWMTTLSDQAVATFLQRQKELRLILRGDYDAPDMQVAGQLPLQVQENYEAQS